MPPSSTPPHFLSRTSTMTALNDRAEPFKRQRSKSPTLLRQKWIARSEFWTFSFFTANMGTGAVQILIVRNSLVTGVCKHR